MISSALFNIAFWLLTFTLGVAGLPFAFINRRCAFIVARLWAKGTLWFARVLCNITYEVRGQENIPAGAALIASKHQSAWETIAFWSLLPKPVFVLKKELVLIPVFGWYLLLLKCICIDRKAGASAMKRMLREAQLRANEDSGIVIFPEGTRIAPGVDAPYHPGVAALYQHLDLPVVPVALNSGLLWGKNSFRKKPGVIIVEFLPPIAPGMKAREFLPLLKERINGASERLFNQSPILQPQHGVIEHRD